jgi:hypothetical protein
MAQEIVLIIFAILFIWAIVLSFFLWRALDHYNTLTKHAKGKNLTGVLEGILGDASATKKEIEAITGRITTLEKDGLFHTQKVGLLRFNPFKDTGGDQSFILALLDGKDNGIVFSSLHSRSGTRWYAKKVMTGKGVDHELSEEEERAIKEAKKTN